MDSMEILCRIERGEMTVRDGISSINKVRNLSTPKVKKGRFIRIRVSDGEDSFNITLPIFILSASLSLIRFAASAAPEGKMDENAVKALGVIRSLDKRDVKMLIDELRKCRSLNFIEIHSRDSRVNISIV